MIVVCNFLLLFWIGLSGYHVDAQTPITSFTDCQGSVFDIVFVLDSSGSVGFDNFTVMKGFVKSIIENLEIGQNQTKVGLITFSRYPSLRINLDSFSDKASLLSAVDGIPYIAGITETQSAIQLLQQEGFKGGRPNAPHVAVVITDGKSFHTNQTSAAAEAARTAGITMFAIGIGTEMNLPELNSIATDPDSQHVYTLSTFASLTTIVNSLTSKSCKAPVITVQTIPPVSTLPPTTPPKITQVNETTGNCNRSLADIVFVLDSSGSLGLLNFTSVKQFVINVVNYLDIGVNYTKVGVITYSNYPLMRISLNGYTDKLSLVNAINNIPYFPGNTETDKALDMLRFEGFEGDRPNAPNIAIVVTDGLSTNPGLTRISASEVKKGGTTLFAIGVGAEIDTDELNAMSSDPDSSYVFFVSNFSSLASIESQVARTTCDEQKNNSTDLGRGCGAVVSALGFLIMLIFLHIWRSCRHLWKVPLMTTTPTPTPGTASVTIPHTPTTREPRPTLAPTTPPMTTPTCIARVADVMFVLDTSGSVGADNFVKIKEFMKQTISVFDIASQYTHIGVITFSTSPRIAFPLNQYNTSTALYTAINNIPYSHGGTNTGSALELLRTTGFAYDRPNAPNIAIVVTDGLSKDSDATKQQAKLAKNANITIIAIGIGNLTDTTELNNMATFDPNTNKGLVYQVGDFAALQTLNNSVAQVACSVVLPPAVMPTTTPATTTPQDCQDAIPNCDEYGSDICYDYAPWALSNCKSRCGLCPTVGATSPMPCLDELNNCPEYGTYICTTVSLIAWTKQNCAKYCGLCGNGTVPTDPPSTLPPSTLTPKCEDRMSNCHEYGGKSMCTSSQYQSWARKNCASYCGFCSPYVAFTGPTLTNNVKCPDWKLPVECTMGTSDGTCCPMPQCPVGFTLTAKSPLEL